MLAWENGFIVLSLVPAPELHIRTLLGYMGQIFGSAKYFVSLSHCWGQTRLIALVYSNFGTSEPGIALEDLLKTHRDAIHFTRFLA
jgi:hypothetical protein